jgi:hypothetical protein
MEARNSGEGASVHGKNEGDGPAAKFEKTDPQSASPALEVSTSGTGPAAMFVGEVHTTVGGFRFPDNTVQTTAAIIGPNVSWNLTGNSGTSPGTNFIGTTDNQPFEVHVNGARVLRLEPAPSSAYSPNVVAGDDGNTVAGGVG